VSSPRRRRPPPSASPPPQVRLDALLPLSSLLSRSWAGRVFTSPFLLLFLLLVDLRARVALWEICFSGRFVCLVKSLFPNHPPVASKAKLPTGCPLNSPRWSLTPEEFKRPAALAKLPE
jgi:hypothetical protein